MLQYVLVGAALSLGQTGTLPPVRPAAELPGSLPPVRSADALALQPPPATPVLFQQPEPPAEPPLEEEKPVIQTEEEAREAPAPSDRWPLMRALQGTWPGYLLEDYRLQLYGWVEGSGNGTTASQNNAPVVWTDRANEFLLQQAWLRFERTVVTNSSTPSWGFRTDWLYGTDYRFTLPRGLWNSQLESAQGTQNLYGVDPISHYLEFYFPTIGRGLDVRVGRWFTPFGVESLEAVSTPLVTRSYAFNFSPPFTHYGVLNTLTLTPAWTVQYAIANGNDVVIGDTAEEPRFVGTIRYAPPGGRDTVTFGTSIGRGKFNAADAFAPVTAALPNEPAGRNNINVFDLVYTHAFNPRMSYAFETIYGYQTSVPANVPGGIIKEDATSGTAHWWSMVHYLFYTISPKLTATARAEFFWDFEGQRTGFEGPYQALTLGMAYKPSKAVWVRPEVRYDHNGYSRPFEGEHDLFFAGADFILRW